MELVCCGRHYDCCPASCGLSGALRTAAWSVRSTPDLKHQGDDVRARRRAGRTRPSGPASLPLINLGDHIALLLPGPAHPRLPTPGRGVARADHPGAGLPCRASKTSLSLWRRSTRTTSRANCSRPWANSTATCAPTPIAFPNYAPKCVALRACPVCLSRPTPLRMLHILRHQDRATRVEATPLP